MGVKTSTAKTVRLKAMKDRKLWRAMITKVDEIRIFSSKYSMWLTPDDDE